MSGAFQIPEIINNMFWFKNKQIANMKKAVRRLGLFVTPLSVVERKMANSALTKQLSSPRMVWKTHNFMWISLSRDPA